MFVFVFVFWIVKMQLDLIYFEMVILALNLVLFDWKAFYA